MGTKVPPIKLAGKPVLHSLPALGEVDGQYVCDYGEPMPTLSLAEWRTAMEYAGFGVLERLYFELTRLSARPVAQRDIHFELDWSHQEAERVRRRIDRLMPSLFRGVRRIVSERQECTPRIFRERLSSGRLVWSFGPLIE